MIEKIDIEIVAIIKKNLMVQADGNTYDRPEQILCFPGAQTALCAVIHAIAGSGDEVITGDPMYATYAYVMASSGAKMVKVP